MPGEGKTARATLHLCLQIKCTLCVPRKKTPWPTCRDHLRSQNRTEIVNKHTHKRKQLEKEEKRLQKVGSDTVFHVQKQKNQTQPFRP